MIDPESIEQSIGGVCDKCGMERYHRLGCDRHYTEKYMTRGYKHYVWIGEEGSSTPPEMPSHLKKENEDE